jgi:hypothetical protein
VIAFLLLDAAQFVPKARILGAATMSYGGFIAGVLGLRVQDALSVLRKAPH